MCLACKINGVININKYPESLPNSVVLGRIFLTSAFLIVLEPKAFGGGNELGRAGKLFGAPGSPTHWRHPYVYWHTSILVDGSLKFIYMWSSSRCKSQLLPLCPSVPPPPKKKFYISNCPEGHKLFPNGWSSTFYAYLTVLINEWMYLRVFIGIHCIQPGTLQPSASLKASWMLYVLWHDSDGSPWWEDRVLLA